MNTCRYMARIAALFLAGVTGTAIAQNREPSRSWHDDPTAMTRRPYGHLADAERETIAAKSASEVPAGANVWRPTQGPEGGLIRALAVDPANPATLYAGTSYAGVFKSIDGGESWASINAGLTSANVYSLAVDPHSPRTLYAGTIDGGVFKSANGGESWRATNEGLAARTVYALAIDPQAPETLYAGTSGGNGGVFKSNDGGESWTDTGLRVAGGSTTVGALAIDPSTTATIYAGTAYRGVFKSTDGGQSWTTAGTGPPRWYHSLVIDPSRPSTLYAAASDFFGEPPVGAFKSTDGGASWTQVLRRGPAFALLMPSSGGVPFVGTSEGVFLINQSFLGLPRNIGLNGLGVFALASDPSSPSTLYAGTFGGGIYKSRNGGANWAAVNHGLVASDVIALAIDPALPATLYAALYRGGVSKSTDGGESWTALNTVLTSPFVFALAIDPHSPRTVYAGAVYDGVFKSTDRGQSWTAINEGLTVPYVQALAIDPWAPATLYAGTYDGVFKSIDGGESWTAAGNLPENYPTVYGLTLDPSAPTTVYALTNGGILKSVDGAASWTETLVDRFVWSLAIDPSSPDTLYAASGVVFKSMDGGASWTEIETSPSEVVSLSIDPLTPATLYAATENGGVFASIDGGESWTRLDAGLTSSRIQILAITAATPSRLYAGTVGAGVFARDLTEFPSSRCTPSDRRLCLVGGRYAVELSASRGDIHGPGAAQPLSDRAGYFALPFATGDPELPEVVVKMLPDGTFGHGAPVFFTSLTSLPFTLTVTDTMSGRAKTYDNDSGNPLCGEADIAFADAAGMSKTLPSSPAPGDSPLRLLGDRFELTLTARDPRTGRTASGRGVVVNDRFGYFSFPEVTGDAELPEVFVKMLDFRWFNGEFAVFHGGLTGFDYKLTLRDSVGGVVRTYASSGAFCGSVHSDAFEN